MTTALEAGRSALQQGDWAAARADFERALSEEETPEGLEGLGLCAWWLDDAGVTFEARERAYLLYTERGDRRGAARVATALAWDYEAFRGESAVASGWVQRARRLIDGLPLAVEHGWLTLRDSEIALRRDTGEARRLAAEGTAIGRELGSLDLEMTGLALDGLALVSAGEIEQGMRQLDEATTAAVGGELTDLYAIGLNCCRLIAACERVGDYERATQWCARMIEFAQRWHMRPFFAVCRTQYASVLMRRGDWGEAETALLEASATLAETRPAMADAVIVRLAELRRRQGRIEEAAALFARAENHPLALLGRAELALDGGDRDGAQELARSFLRRVPTRRHGGGGRPLRTRGPAVRGRAGARAAGAPDRR